MSRTIHAAASVTAFGLAVSYNFGFNRNDLYTPTMACLIDSQAQDRLSSVAINAQYCQGKAFTAALVDTSQPLLSANSKLSTMQQL
jgi:hypothetical protein